MTTEKRRYGGCGPTVRYDRRRSRRRGMCGRPRAGRRSGRRTTGRGASSRGGLRVGGGAHRSDPVLFGSPGGGETREPIYKSVRRDGTVRVQRTATDRAQTARTRTRGPREGTATRWRGVPRFVYRRGRGGGSVPAVRFLGGLRCRRVPRHRLGGPVYVHGRVEGGRRASRSRRRDRRRRRIGHNRRRCGRGSRDR